MPRACVRASKIRHAICGLVVRGVGFFTGSPEFESGWGQGAGQGCREFESGWGQGAGQRSAAHRFGLVQCGVCWVRGGRASARQRFFCQRYAERAERLDQTRHAVPCARDCPRSAARLAELRAQACRPFCRRVRRTRRLRVRAGAVRGQRARADGDSSSSSAMADRDSVPLECGGVV